MINEYETQSELNPKLWADDHFNEKLRLQLLKIARAFYKFLGVDVEKILVSENLLFLLLSLKCMM